MLTTFALKMYPFALLTPDRKPLRAGYSAGPGPLKRRYPGPWTPAANQDHDLVWSWQHDASGLTLELLIDAGQH